MLCARQGKADTQTLAPPPPHPHRSKEQQAAHHGQLRLRRQAIKPLDQAAAHALRLAAAAVAAAGGCRGGSSDGELRGGVLSPL
jgi:hypothetical protein